MKYRAVASLPRLVANQRTRNVAEQRACAEFPFLAGPQRTPRGESFPLDGQLTITTFVSSRSGDQSHFEDLHNCPAATVLESSDSPALLSNLVLGSPPGARLMFVGASSGGNSAK